MDNVERRCYELSNAARRKNELDSGARQDHYMNLLDSNKQQWQMIYEQQIRDYSKSASAPRGHNLTYSSSPSPYQMEGDRGYWRGSEGNSVEQSLEGQFQQQTSAFGG